MLRLLMLCCCFMATFAQAGARKDVNNILDLFHQYSAEANDDAYFDLMIREQSETTVFLSAMFALRNAAITYSIHMISQGKDIGHKTYPASLVSLTLVIFMIYLW